MTIQEEKNAIGGYPNTQLIAYLQNENLFAFIENLQPKWCKICYKRQKFQLQLKTDKHSYHYAEGNSLEELFKNLRMRLEKFAIAG